MAVKLRSGSSCRVGTVLFLLYCHFKPHWPLHWPHASPCRTFTINLLLFFFSHHALCCCCCLTLVLCALPWWQCLSSSSSSSSCCAFILFWTSRLPFLSSFSFFPSLTFCLFLHLLILFILLFSLHTFCFSSLLLCLSLLLTFFLFLYFCFLALPLPSAFLSPLCSSLLPLPFFYSLPLCFLISPCSSVLPPFPDLLFPLSLIYHTLSALPPASSLFSSSSLFRCWSVLSRGGWR